MSRRGPVTDLKRALPLSQEYPQREFENFQLIYSQLGYQR